MSQQTERHSFDLQISILHNEEYYIHVIIEK